MTGATPEEAPREGKDLPPQPPPESAAVPAPLKPGGAILTIDGPLRWAWVDPSAVRPLANFGAWHRAMMGNTPEEQDCAGIDAMVVTLSANAVIKPGMIFHLEIPGEPPHYMKFQVESKNRDPVEATKPSGEKEFVCLLLRVTTGTAHPVALKEKAIDSEERMKGKFA